MTPLAAMNRLEVLTDENCTVNKNNLYHGILYLVTMSESLCDDDYARILVLLTRVQLNLALPIPVTKTQPSESTEFRELSRRLLRLVYRYDD